MTTETKRTLFCLLLALLEMAIYFSNDTYLPALPQMTSEFHISARTAELTLTAWQSGFAALFLVMGPVSDYFGRRTTLLWGNALFIFSTALAVVTHNFTVLLLARFLQGASTGCVIIPGYATLHELLDRQRAIAMTAWMWGFTTLAPAFGPMLGSIILLFGDWRMTFLLLSLWGCSLAVGLYFFTPETLSSRARRFCIKQVVADYLVILRTPEFIRNALSATTLINGLIVWIVAGPFLVITTYHHSPQWFGVFQIVIFSGFIIGTSLTNRLIRYFTAEQIIKVSLMMCLISSAIAVILSLLIPNQLLTIILPLSAFGLGTSLLSAPMQRLAVEACSVPMGSRVSMMTFFLGAISVIVTLFVNFFYHNNIPSLALMIFAIALIGNAIWWRQPAAMPAQA